MNPRRRRPHRAEAASRARARPSKRRTSLRRPRCPRRARSCSVARPRRRLSATRGNGTAPRGSRGPYRARPSERPTP
jgi:hypothetical protein